MSKHTSQAVCLRGWEKGPRNAEVLLVCEESKTNADKESWRWSLPGGKCCAITVAVSDCCEEKPEETVLREFQEETGYEGKVISSEWSEEVETPGTTLSHTRHVFRVEIMGGAPLQKKVFLQETPKWFLLSQLPRNLFPSHRKIVERVVLDLLLKKDN